MRNTLRRLELILAVGVGMTLIMLLGVAINGGAIVRPHEQSCPATITPDESIQGARNIHVAEDFVVIQETPPQSGVFVELGNLRRLTITEATIEKKIQKAYSSGGGQRSPSRASRCVPH